ncbi:hypothetical protein Y032_0040g229 [Ancylostoma ceylanicum]|uniref:glucuronosyltransferase n=1 Tax=Ancylostoma ceylanicum TaxID=53326 RepID=A0A016UIS9_9BILA|nr:hypothetical protein Y032_0040g229 [Ancylostoma ceylanicum]
MIEQHVIEYIYENELVHFRKKFGDMKGYADLLSQASFLFTNGNPYLDFAHPTLHKTVMIGGISVEQDAMNMKEIDQKWSTILSARPHTVLISFGSMAKSIDMPVHYRQALLDTFSSFPNVTFIWKYENEDSSIAADHPNVYLSSWVPQTALLNDQTYYNFGNETEIKYEIMTRGPVVATYKVYRDFDYYRKGVYIVCFSSIEICSRNSVCLLKSTHNPYIWCYLQHKEGEVTG